MPTDTTTNPYPDVALPARADFVYDWDDPGTPDAYRCFQACHRRIEADEAGDPIFAQF
jgi:hypothetical protein